MIVVIPVCHKDAAIAVRNIEHAFMLDGQVDFQAVIAHERGWDASATTEAAECYFKGVSHIVYEPWKGDKQWPQIQNWCWSSVAREIVALNKPWFWWEADATPVKIGWLTALRDAYKSGKRPFAGACTQLNGLNYMAGVAIYPPNTPDRCSHALFARTEAFDVVAGVRDGILRNTHDISSLIAHTPSVNNTHFTCHADVEKYVPESAVLFHKCKDGSLLNVLQGKTPSDELINPADNAPSFCEQTPWPCGYFTFPTASNTVYFNCSFAKVGDSLHLFTRRQRFNIDVRGRAQKQNKSDLAIWKVRHNMTLEPNAILPTVPQRYPMEQWEDPRAMVGADGRIYLGMATWVHYKNWSIRQSFARLTHDWRTLEPLFEAPYGGNTRIPATGRTHEKNWIWFEHDGRWTCQYSINPGEFFSVDGKGNVIQSWKSPEITVPWTHGLPLRGGTPLTRVGDELIGFFHTSTVWNKPKRRYFMGAYALEGKPPFRLRRMTTEPLLIGSEHDFRALGGPLVIFPNGALLDGDDWLVTFGVNDEACGWIKIPHKELQGVLKPV
jgi:predicted GH43/DUF377 family glycosyl hydrolase